MLLFTGGKLMKRDYYLDFLRGIAALNIIIIHTAFWSGEGYVPTIIKNLTLLLDVPFFFLFIRMELHI